jgi:superfamily II helicase
VIESKYDCTCLHCKRSIKKGEKISFSSNKYKIHGEEICSDCVDIEEHKQEGLLDRMSENSFETLFE